LSRTEVVLPEHLPPAVRAAARAPAAASAAAELPTETATPSGDAPVRTLEETEVEMIRRALEQTGGNRTRAAKLLGISRRGLIYKIKRLGIY
jgi:DNA-binding NtrC family response regulator